MAYKVKMPKFGETMTEGTIYKWLLSEGEKVKEGEPLFEIETDKATLEVEAPMDGIIGKIMVKEGEIAPIGGMVAVIIAENEDVEDIDISIEKDNLNRNKEEANKVKGKDKRLQLKPGGNKIKASPAARRLAREGGINLTEVQPGNNREVIIEKDISTYLAEETDTREDDKGMPSEEYPLNQIRKITARNMIKSYREIPHVTLTTEVGMQETVYLKNKLEENTSLHITYTDIIVMIAARAIAANPHINSRYRDDSIEVMKDINIGIAVDTEEGLVVPVIKQVDKLNLEKLAEKRVDLVKRAREGKLDREEMEGGTFTVTNLGGYDIEIFTPIINPGEAAILGVGTIKEKPVAIDRKVKIKPVMWLSLSFDHRVTDGASAAQFLVYLKNLLESPLNMLL